MVRWALSGFKDSFQQIRAKSTRKKKANEIFLEKNKYYFIVVVEKPIKYFLVIGISAQYKSLPLRLKN